MGEGDARRWRVGDEQRRHHGVEVAGRAGSDIVEDAVAGGDDELVIQPRARANALHDSIIEADDVAEGVEVGEGRQRGVGGDDQQIAGGVYGQVGRGPGRGRGGGDGRRFATVGAGGQGQQRRHDQHDRYSLVKRH